MRNRLALGFQIASLALTGWFLWGARLWSHRAPISVFDVLVRSTTYALVAFAAGLVITAVLYMVSARQWERCDRSRYGSRTQRLDTGA